MLCQGCGFTNSSDSGFCSMCGAELTPVALGALPCPSCSFLNEDAAAHCRACGRPIKAEVAVGASFRADLRHFLPLLEPPGDGSPPAREWANDESLLKRLDRMEREISLRLEEKIPILEPELEPDWSEKESNLTSLSCTLDELLAELVEAEINEYLTPDSIHPDETGFPGPAAPGERPARRGRHLVDVLFIAALVVAIFLFGVTAGLWGSYVLGI